MGQAEILIAGLLVAVAGLSALARYLSVPYPIVLVVGGALFGFVPGVPDVKLDPEVVLVVFLPPLLYGASIFANFNDLRANLRPLTLITVGWIAAEIRKRTTDAQVSITISLLTGYAAFVPADAIGASGVLATVTAGIYMGIRGPQILAARTRLQGYFVWDILDFIINAILFVLIGLQLRAVVDALSGYPAGTLAGYALAVTGVVVGTRLVWLFTVPYLIRAIDRRPAQRARRVGARWRLVMAWSGMRGAVSLAVALALPLTTDAGGAFPKRDLIIFLTFAVIFFTLVVQGLTLPALIRRLEVSDGGADADEELRARLVATKAALDQIDVLEGEEWTRDETVER